MEILIREETPADIPASRHGIRCQWEVPEEIFMILALEPERLAGKAGPARYRDEFSMVSRWRGQ